MAERSGTPQEEVKELTKQFFVTLRAYVARLDKEDENRSAKSFKQIEDLLESGEATWSNAYQIEQLLVDLFDERHLEVELQSRLLECESNLRPALAAHYVKAAGTLKEPAERRALLARLVNDLQWRYTVNEVKRTYSKDITKITGLIFIVGIAAFAAAVLGIAVFGKALLAASDAAHLLLAGLAGGWGAGFSMLASLKTRMDAADLNDLKLMSPSGSCGRALSSAWGLRASFISSSSRDCSAGPRSQRSNRRAGTRRDEPEPNRSGRRPGDERGGRRGRHRGLTNTPDFAKGSGAAHRLVFIAGFSERMVPALLAKTEGRVSGQSGLDSDRFKPDADAASRGIAASTTAPKQDSPAVPSGQGAQPPKTS